ncbi:MAG TPA: ATP-binding protein [Acidimicrobiales bacterium]|nr:ATP-binding protein [Acidimicrobiales bacterium]
MGSAQNMSRHSQALPHVPEAAREARRVVESLLGDTQTLVDIEFAALLTGEVVTNAVQHGTPPLQLLIEIADDAIRVEVHDTNSAHPVPRTPRPTEPGGRGLAIVDALATRWGTRPDDDGKAVWFEVAAGSEPASESTPAQ